MASEASRLALGVVAAAVIGVGVIWLVPSPNSEVSVPEIDASNDTVALVPAQPATQETSKAADEPARTVAVPTVGMRVENDGIMVVSGRAQGADAVDILVDDDIMERLPVDASGAFATVLLLEPSEKARMLSAIADPDGEAIRSELNPLILPTVRTENVEIADAPLIAGAVTVPGQDETVEEGSDLAEDNAVASADKLDQSEAPDTVAVSDDQAVITIGEEEADAETATVAEAEATVEEALPDGSDAVADLDDTTTTIGHQPSTENMAGTTALTDSENADVASNDALVSTEDAEALEDITETAQQIQRDATDASTSETVAVATDLTESVEASETALSVVDSDVAPAEETAVADQDTMLVADADGVRVIPTEGAAPQVLANVALDSISYDLAGEVLLTGRGTGDGFVQVYVDNQPVTTSRITEGGNWRTDLPEVDTGVYTLRIDEVAGDGTVISRIETPFKREEPETVAAVMAEETADEDFKVAVRTVQPGATLWAIAREQFGEGILYVAVYEANKDQIRNPDLIYPGQVFKIPKLAE